MGRKATGCAQWDPRKAAWVALITIDGGKRVPVEMPGLVPHNPACACTAKEPCETRAAAARQAAIVSKRARDGGAVLASSGETCDEYHDRILAFVRARGRSDVANKDYRWRVWIKPEIGNVPIASLTRDRVEALRDKLDDAQRAWLKLGKAKGRLAPKTAANVWSELTSTMREAYSSKRKELRVLTSYPCEGIQPPDKGDARRKPFVFPSEFLALITSDDVPAEWKEIHAIACYTFLRPGELRVLRWSDVDTEHGILSVTKAWDYQAKTVKTPKTRSGVRRVPIAPELLPLLKKMRDASKESALVAPLMSTWGEDYLAQTTRAHLLAAGVDRPELHHETRTTLAFGFRGWRDTGITWACIAGLDLAKIQARAGHDAIGTTLGYVKAAESLAAGFGTPFPPLPEFRKYSVGKRPKLPESLCAGRDLNPYRSYPTRT